jgi:hypothetical protein
MTVYQNAEFVDQTIHVDHNAFYNCRFLRCTLVFSGGMPGPINIAHFQDCVWIFDGPARTAVDLLSLMLRTPGADEMAAKMLGLTRGNEPISAGTPQEASPGPAS